jgi:hypothetical protein
MAPVGRMRDVFMAPPECIKTCWKQGPQNPPLIDPLQNTLPVKLQGILHQNKSLLLSSHSKSKHT